jgi:hypothetical protein
LAFPLVSKRRGLAALVEVGFGPTSFLALLDFSWRRPWRGVALRLSTNRHDHDDHDHHYGD